MSLNVYGAIKMARTLGEQAGLSVVFEDDSQPRTDKNTIYVQRPSEQWEKEDWISWWGAFYHEIGHHDPDMRDCFTLQEEKKIGMDSFFGVGINILDDHRQEHHRIDEYAGRRNALSASQNQILDKMIAEKAFGKGDEKDKERMVMETMMAYDTHCRESWMPHISSKGLRIRNMLHEQGQHWFDKLVEEHDKYNFSNLETAIQEYDLWKDMLDNVFQIDSSEKEKEAQQSYKPGKGDGSGEEEEGKGGKSKGKRGGEGDDASDDDGGKRTEQGSAKYEDLLKHKHGDTELGSIYTPMSIEYGENTTGAWDVVDPNVLDYKEKSCRPDGRYVQRIHKMAHTGKGLANTVRRLLQIRSKAKRVYGQKKGKLNGRSLHRLAVNDSREYSERVFTQKHENNILDVAVTVLGDGSGSMGGRKYAHMAQSAILLNDALGMLRVPLEILTFSDDIGRQNIGIIKSFQEKVNYDKLVDRFADFTNYMGNNADGEAILYAYSRLTQQRANRKVLIVLSDGSPASCRGDSDSHTRQVVKNIQKGREVEIYGIGIQDDNVERIYRDNKVINNPQELEGALINVIKTKILG